MDVGKRVNASIKGEERQYEKGGDNQSPKPWCPRKKEENKSTKLPRLSDEIH